MIDEWKDVMCADAVGGEASLAACGAAAGETVVVLTILLLELPRSPGRLMTPPF
jgi:hypothetical protein